MSGTIRATANDILSQVGAECGLDPHNDPWSSDDQSYRQMRALLNIAGEELSQLYPWEVLRREHAITTLGTDSGDYDLPDDFLYMIDQTGWERAENVPLMGPLSPQDWAYLLGKDLVSYTIYASFRLKQDKFSIFPQPPPDGLNIRFEYISRNWVLDSEAPTESYKDAVTTGADTPMFNRTLMGRMLKAKFLEAKGMDTSKVQADLNQIFHLLIGRNKGAPILQMGANHRGFPYLNNIHNLPDSGYGN